MYNCEIVTEYDVEIIQSEALLEVARACRDYEHSRMDIATESYSELNEYSVTTEGAIGNFFKSIGDAIANFFRKIIEFFKNLFGKGSGGGSSSGSTSSGSKEKPLDEVAKDIEKNKDELTEIINVINDVEDALDLALDDANFKPKANESASEYEKRIRELFKSKGITEDSYPELYNIVVINIKRGKKKIEARIAEEEAKRTRDAEAKRIAEEKARKAEEAEREAKRKAEEEVRKAEREAKRKAEEREKSRAELNKRMSTIIHSVKGDYFYLTADDNREVCRIPIPVIIKAFENVMNHADMISHIIEGDISGVKKVIDDFANMDPGDERRDAKTSYAVNTSIRMGNAFNSDEDKRAADLSEAIYKASLTYFSEVDNCKDISELKNGLNASLFESRTKGEPFFITISKISDELKAYDNIDELDKECKKLVAVLQERDKQLHDVVSDAKDTIEKMSKKYENDKDMTATINKIKASLTEAVNGTIRTYSMYTTVCAMLKRAATSRRNILKHAESSIRFVEKYMNSDARFGNSKKYTGKRKVSESCTLESAMGILNAYF